jgi:hypothetical protein
MLKRNFTHTKNASKSAFLKIEFLQVYNKPLQNFFASPCMGGNLYLKVLQSVQTCLRKDAKNENEIEAFARSLFIGLAKYKL